MLEEARLDVEYLKKLEGIIPARDPQLIPSKATGRVIPVCEPRLAGNELKYVTECIKTNWISSTGGRYIQKFEEEFAVACGVKHAISCTSGTTALHLALAALGIKETDEVIIPAFTMIATANAIRYLGAKPVLVDSEGVSWNIDTDKIEDKITPHTKAIIPVHTYGHPARMDKILEIARRYNLYVVEDAAEAHGAEYKGKRVGGIGDIGCFSFYANKIITTGEGGMLTTNNDKIARIARILKNHAFSEERHFWHKYPGFNYRFTNLQGAIGLAQMEKFDELLQARIENAQYYSSLLSDVKAVTLPVQKEDVKNVYWMYSILIEDGFGMGRNELRNYLASRGIETRTFFIPIHFQPIYFKMYKERFPVSEELCRRGLYLPSSSSLKKEDIDFVTKSIKDAFNPQ